MRKRELKNIEWSILIVAIILCFIGLIALFSATQNAEYDEFYKQCIWLTISIVIMLAVMIIDYELLVKVSPVLYRNIYSFVNSGIIYKTNKWCYQLV